MPIEFVLLSVPYDHKSSLRKGAQEGPHAIKAAFSEDVFSAFTETGIDIREETILIERGPVPISDSFLVVEDVILKEVARVRKEQILVSLGGDHSITYPLFKGVRKIHSHLNLVCLSSHPDLHGEYQGDRFSHACAVARILELGQAGEVVLAGVRSITADQRLRAAEHGVKMIEARRFRDAMGLAIQGPTYLSIDLGVLDPAYAPGVGNPVPGGISTRELFDWIQSFDADIVAFDLCEMNPRWDRAGITTLAAARTLMEVIGHVIERRTRS
ncbi:MAG: arginase family protein [Planctomycetes bacterium]|nr:arginase family protein [Planctomycetota bacterium]